MAPQRGLVVVAQVALLLARLAALAQGVALAAVVVVQVSQLLELDSLAEEQAA